MTVYKDKERGTWLVKFRYKDWQCNVKFTTKRGFKTKREAVNYEREFKADAVEQADKQLTYLRKNILNIKSYT